MGFCSGHKKVVVITGLVVWRGSTVIVITLSLENAWIMLGEILCWSLLGLEGLMVVRQKNLNQKSLDSKHTGHNIV